MDADQWREAEFTALRTEILTLGEAERSAVKFYIPAVAVVYAIPYYLSEKIASTMFDARGQAALWTFCVVVTELLTLAMLQTLFWSVDGARRIGVYIKTAIEPRTSYTLRWESVFHELTQDRKQYLSDSATVGAVSVVANIFASCAVGFIFLDARYWWWPFVPTTVMTFISCVVLSRIFASGSTRRKYAARYEAILKRKSYINADPESESTAGSTP